MEYSPAPGILALDSGAAPAHDRSMDLSLLDRKMDGGEVLEAPKSLGLPTVRGRQPDSFEAEIIRPVTEEDLEKLKTQTRGSKPPALQKIRDSHHALARAIAQGMSQTEAARNTGFSVSRVSILLQDPTFSDLVAFYRERVNEAYMDLHERIKLLSVDAVEELHDRLRSEPDKISTSTLLELTTRILDRAGHSPVQRSESKHLHVHLNPSEIQELKKVSGVKDARSNSSPPGLIEVSAVDAGEESLSKPQPDRDRLDLGSTICPTSGPGEAYEVVRDSGEGNDLREARRQTAAA